MSGILFPNGELGIINDLMNILGRVSVRVWRIITKYNCHIGF